MNLQDRDRRALRMLGIAAAIAIPFYFLTRTPDTAVAPVTGATVAETPEMAEKRLTRTRERAALLPNREATFKKAAAELALRENGMIQADTAAQAQAQLFQIMRRVGRSQRPPVEVRSTEIGQVKNFADDYGEVIVSVSFECMVEQLVNLLADIASQPEVLATAEIRIGAAAGDQKILPVRLTVSGIVPRKLIPQKKGIQF